MTNFPYFLRKRHQFILLMFCIFKTIFCVCRSFSTIKFNIYVNNNKLHKQCNVGLAFHLWPGSKVYILLQQPHTVLTPQEEEVHHEIKRMFHHKCKINYCKSTYVINQSTVFSCSISHLTGAGTFNNHLSQRFVLCQWI